MPLRRVLGRVAHLAGVQKAEDTASCARALTAHVGRPSPIELLPGGASQLTRASLTARVMAAQDPVPWPGAIMRQLDPGDAAYLPPLAIHPVLAARDRTLLGLPGRERVAWVDHLGWIGQGDGPSLTTWFAEGRKAWTVGRRPDQRGVEVMVDQKRSDEVFGVITTTRRGDLQLEVHQWPIVMQGRLAWAMHLRLTLMAAAPRSVRLGVAIRPACMDGASPIFQLVREPDGTWFADGLPLLAVGRKGDEILTGQRGQPDSWHRFAGMVMDRPPAPKGRVVVRCTAGMANAAEVWRTTLSPGEPFSRLVVFRPPPGTTGALVRTSGRALWSGARADRQGLLASGAEIELAQDQPVFEACRLRLLLRPEDPGLAGCLGAVALARMGFTRRAGDRLERWLSAVGRGGRVPGQEAEDAAVLAWAAAAYAWWTGDRAWVRSNLEPWTRVLDRLVEHSPGPGGRYLVGPDGSERWSAMWRAAALLAGAASLRGLSPRHAQWALAGGRLREDLPALMGEAPWSAAPGRAPDGSAAAMLAASWLGLVRPEHPALAATARYVAERHMYGGGVLLHGGASVSATALLLAVLGREGGVDAAAKAISQVAALASSTGALPTARHPTRGALIEGDDALSVALFGLLALDLLQVEQGSLTLLPGLARARDLPTPFGRIDIDSGPDGTRRVIGRWRGRPPQVTVVEGPLDRG